MTIKEGQGRIAFSNYIFANQFFAQIAADEKPRLRGGDKARLAQIRQHPDYEKAFTDPNPLISVIIPTYNRAQTIVERTLPCLQAQTYRNLDIVIVGDAMDEENAAILQAIDDPRVRFYNLKFRGRYPEMEGPRWYTAGIKPINFGMRVALGQWISHLDDDDEFYPDHLAALLDVARSKHAEWVHSQIMYKDDDGTPKAVVGEETPSLGQISRIASLYHAGLKTFRYNPKCWRYFLPGDWDLYERLLEMEVRHAYLPRVTGIHNGNVSRVNEISQVDQIIRSGVKPEETEKPEERWKKTYQRWATTHHPLEIDGQIYAERMLRWKQFPVFQIVVFAIGSELPLLADTLDSLSAQLYSQWHLSVISDTDCPVPELLEGGAVSWHRFSGEGDPKILFDHAVKEIGADWIGFFEAGTVFEPNLLNLLGDYQHLHPEWRLIYTDDDALNADQERINPRIKPDFDADYLRSWNYIGHYFIRHDVFTACGGYSRHPGAQNYDLLLRASDHAGEAAIGHIAEVLYHLGHDAYVQQNDEQEARAVADHLTRQSLVARVEDGYLPHTRRIIYQHDREPSVTIIIPTKDKLEFFRPCIESLFALTRYSNFDVIVVDNQSTDPDTLAYYPEIVARWPGRVHILKYEQPFNFAAICNAAAKAAQGEFLLLLNNDTQIVQGDWLGRMVMHGMRPDSGAVGARLVFPETARIQHAGVVLGLGSSADHIFISCNTMSEAGYMNRLQVDQCYSAVTAACLLVRKTDYTTVDGMNETDFGVLFNDVDLCLKLQAMGRRNRWTPYATLVHHGSTSLGEIPDIAKLAEKNRRSALERNALSQRWLKQLIADPHYNRHLSLSFSDSRLDANAPLNWDPNFHDRTRILGYPLSGGSGLYRVTQPFSALSDAGRLQCEYVRHGSDGNAQLLSVMEMARMAPDVLVFHAALDPMQIEALESYGKILPNLTRIFMLDDLVTQVPEKSSVYKRFMANLRDAKPRLRKALAHCDRLIVSTQPLADLCADMIDDIRVVPNRLRRDPWCTLTSLRGQGRKLRVGWAGAQQHQGDLELIEPVVTALANEVEWVFMGMMTDGLRPHVHEFHNFVPINDYPAKLASLNLDLAIAPLEEHPFNDAKSNLRLLEYGILGWPVVCSDVYPYRSHEAPVFRLPNQPAAWIAAIRQLIADPAALSAAGDRLKEWVLKDFVLEDHLDEWQAALTDPIQDPTGK